MESTKPEANEQPLTDEESEIILARVEQIRRERDSGAGINLKEISMLEWKLILTWDALIEHHERNLRLYAKALFEALATRGI